MKIIKVTFVPRIRATSFNQKDYYINTDSYEVAHTVALDQLAIDVGGANLRYYSNVVMDEIKLLNELSAVD